MARRLFRVLLAWALTAALAAPTALAAWEGAIELYVREAAAAETEVTWEDLAFPFVNSEKERTSKDMPGIGYEACASADGKPYKIPYERYTEIFNETAQAIAYYNSAQKWRGSCYGMAVVAALLYQHQRQLNSTGMLPVSGRPHDLMVDFDNLKDDKLVQFIEAIQVSQQDSIIQHDYAKNKDRYDDLVSEVRAFQRSKDHPVLIAIGMTGQAHALIGYKVVEYSETETRIMVYDCNLPGPDRWITLEKDRQGHYFRWYYRMNDNQDWGPKYDEKGSWISYVPYSDYYQTWINRPDVNGNSKEQLLTINVNNAFITDEYGENKVEIKDGVVYTSETDVYPMVELAVTADAPLVPQADSTGVYVWLPTGHQYTVTNRDGGTWEATMVHVKQYATVTTAAQSVTFYVDDAHNLNAVEIGDPGAKYEIELYSTLPNTEKIAQLRGSTTLMVSADKNPLSFVQADGKLYGDNVSNASLTIGQEEVSTTWLTDGAHAKIDDFLPFVDVSQDSAYYNAVCWAVENDITKGTSYSPKKFSPGNPCKHSHILTFLWRANHSPIYQGKNPFKDINAESDFGKAALWAYGHEMISPETYKPNDACTRSEAVMYLWKLAKSPAIRGDALNDVIDDFTDVSADSPYAQAVAWAVNLGITKGTTETTFSPDKTCTRGQIVTFLYRCYAADNAN
ncbi:MAG: S-layer homology domain-containing protein [Oscillibacter sp.]|nr:S-layer homology domain-containing protein [Oscillibacter sp.]